MTVVPISPRKQYHSRGTPYYSGVGFLDDKQIHGNQGLFPLSSEIKRTHRGYTETFVSCIPCDTQKSRVYLSGLPHDMEYLGPGLPSPHALPLPCCSITKRGVMGVDDLPAARAQTQNTGATRELYLIFIVGIPPQSAMEPRNQGSLGT